MSNFKLKSFDHFWQHQLINTSFLKECCRYEYFQYRKTEKQKQREPYLLSKWQKRLEGGDDLITSCVCSLCLFIIPSFIHEIFMEWQALSRCCTRYCTSLHSLQLSSNYFSCAKNRTITILAMCFFMLLLCLWFIFKILATCITICRW